MTHPSVEAILANEATAHLARCDACRKLATMLGVEVPAIDELPRVDDRVYTDWTPLPVRGGMGRIFRVRDRRLGRYVAIKQLHPGLGADERARLVRRFEHEARLTARLQHPAIVGIHEAGRFENGEPFYAMPLLSGAPLSDEIAKRDTLAKRLALLPHLITVVEAVAYAHGEGIVHRDIKPDNILIGAFGETVLIDWGLAKEVGDNAPELELPLVDDGLTQLGVGTPQYMPPEQARGEAPDPRVDIYALGATIYHALGGEPPYGRTSGGTAIRRELATITPQPLEEIVPDVPRELADIVARAMDRDPAVRFASAQALADELRRFQTGQLLTTRRYTFGELVRHFARRHRTALRIGAIATAVLVVVATLAVVRITRERDRARRELRRAQGTIASQRSTDPAQRLNAITLGLEALDLESPIPEALQGLVDAVTAGPPLVPLAHTGIIKSFATSNDRLYGVDDARALLVWDARTGKLLARYPTSLAQPERVAVDARHAIVCGFDTKAAIFDLATGAEHAFESPSQFVGCGFLADGRAIVAADAVTLRDANGKVVESFALPSPASGMAIAKSNVAVSTLDGTLWLWSPGQPPRTTKSVTGAVLQFDHAEHTLYLAGSDQTVHALDVATLADRVVHAEKTLHLANVTVSADDRRVAIGMFDLDLRRQTLIVPGAVIDGIASEWSHEPDWLFVEHRGPIAIVDASTRNEVLHLEAHHDEVAHDAFGDRLATAGRDGPAFLWDLAHDRASGLLLGHSSEIVALAVDGDTIFSASHDGTARIWRQTGEVVIRGDAEITVAAAGAIGDLAGVVRTIDADGHERSRVQAKGPISAITTNAFGTLEGELHIGSHVIATPAVSALATDGKRVVSAHADGSTMLWDLDGHQLARIADNEPLEVADEHEGHERLVWIGDTIYASRPAGHTLVLDARTLAETKQLDGRIVGVDGTRLATASVDGSVMVGTAKLVGHRAAVLAAAFAGSRLATGSVDGSIRIWDLATGATTLTITPSLGAVTALAWLDDWLVAGYASGALRIYPTTARTAHDRARTILDRFTAR